jgi:uncharacterized repeat protein (TIGR01451 family)
MKTKQVIILFVLLFSILNFVSATDEPTLVKVTDSLGNVQTNSWAKGTGGDWQNELRDQGNYYCSNCIIKIGDKITFTITANQENLEYRCYDATEIISDWSILNTCNWTVKKEDYGSGGINIGIRNDNGLDYMGYESGDDYTYMTYMVKENDSPIISSENSVVIYVDAPNNASAGDIIALDVVLTNEGTDTPENFFVTATIPELGVQKKAPFGDSPNNGIKVYLTIPSDAQTGIYQIEVWASNYDASLAVKKNITIAGLNISNSIDVTVITETNQNISNNVKSKEDSNTQKKVMVLLVILLLIAIGYIIYSKNKNK